MGEIKFREREREIEGGNSAQEIKLHKNQRRIKPTQYLVILTIKLGHLHIKLRSQNITITTYINTLCMSVYVWGNMYKFIYLTTKLF